MAGPYNYSNVTFQFDNASGTPQTIEVLTINGINVKAEVDDVTPNGVQYQQRLYAGLITVDDLELEVVYTETVDGLFSDPGCRNTSGGTRTFTIGYGGTKTTSVETIIGSYQRVPAKGKVTLAKVTLHPTGSITEA